MMDLNELNALQGVHVLRNTRPKCTAQIRLDVSL